MLDWQCCNMFRDYTAASSKMKSNYSKLYDITAVQWNVHGYVMPLTNLKGFAKIFLQIWQILHTRKTKGGGIVRIEMSSCWTNQAASQELKHWLVFQKTFYLIFNDRIYTVQEVEFRVHFIRRENKETNCYSHQILYIYTYIHIPNFDPEYDWMGHHNAKSSTVGLL